MTAPLRTICPANRLRRMRRTLTRLVIRWVDLGVRPHEVALVLTSIAAEVEERARRVDAELGKELMG